MTFTSTLSWSLLYIFCHSFPIQGVKAESGQFNQFFCWGGGYHHTLLHHICVICRVLCIDVLITQPKLEKSFWKVSIIGLCYIPVLLPNKKHFRRGRGFKWVDRINYLNFSCMCSIEKCRIMDQFHVHQFDFLLHMCICHGRLHLVKQCWIWSWIVIYSILVKWISSAFLS